MHGTCKWNGAAGGYRTVRLHPRAFFPACWRWEASPHAQRAHPRHVGHGVVRSPHGAAGLLQGLNKVKLIDAGFVWTEPHSRRLKIKLTIQKEVTPPRAHVHTHTLTLTHSHSHT